MKGLWEGLRRAKRRRNNAIIIFKMKEIIKNKNKII